MDFIATMLASEPISKLVTYVVFHQEAARKKGAPAFHLLDHAPVLIHVLVAKIKDLKMTGASDDKVYALFDDFVEQTEVIIYDDDDLFSLESRLFLSYLCFDLKYNYTSILGFTIDTPDLEIYKNIIHWFFTWIRENHEIIEKLLPESFK